MNNAYTFPLGAKTWRIVRSDICAGLRGTHIRIEQRRDGSVAARFRNRYLRVERCELRPKVAPVQPARTKSSGQPARSSKWNQDFDLKMAPKIWQAAQGSGARREKS